MFVFIISYIHYESAVQIFALFPMLTKQIVLEFLQEETCFIESDLRRFCLNSPK